MQHFISRHGSLLVAASLVIGCSGTTQVRDPFYHNPHLAPVTYQGHVDTTSRRSVVITSSSGVVTSPTVDQLILPGWITRGSWAARNPNQSGTFDYADQGIFQESFRAELERSGIVAHAESRTDLPSDFDIHIHLWFANAEYLRSAQRYILYVGMTIQEHDGIVRGWRYVADSNEGVSFGKAMMSSGSDSKARVAAILMKKVIPDVQLWLKSSESPPLPTQATTSAAP